MTEGRFPAEACSSGSCQGAQPCSRAHLCVQTCAAAPVQPVRALLPEIALLLSAARFTPENTTAGRACSGVTIKGQAVGGKKQVPLFRMPTSLRFRFKSALGAHLSPSLGHPGAFPRRQARSRGRLPSSGGSPPRPLPSGESGYLECQARFSRSGRRPEGLGCGEWRTVGRLGGETRNLGGGNTSPFIF